MAKKWFTYNLKQLLNIDEWNIIDKKQLSNFLSCSIISNNDTIGALQADGSLDLIDDIIIELPNDEKGLLLVRNQSQPILYNSTQTWTVNGSPTTFFIYRDEDLINYNKELAEYYAWSDFKFNQDNFLKFFPITHSQFLSSQELLNVLQQIHPNYQYIIPSNLSIQWSDKLYIKNGSITTKALNTNHYYPIHIQPNNHFYYSTSNQITGNITEWNTGIPIAETYRYDNNQIDYNTTNIASVMLDKSNLSFIPGEPIDKTFDQFSHNMPNFLINNYQMIGLTSQDKIINDQYQLSYSVPSYYWFEYGMPAAPYTILCDNMSSTENLRYNIKITTDNISVNDKIYPLLPHDKILLFKEAAQWHTYSDNVFLPVHKKNWAKSGIAYDKGWLWLLDTDLDYKGGLYSQHKIILPSFDYTKNVYELKHSKTFWFDSMKFNDEHQDWTNVSKDLNGMGTDVSDKYSKFWTKAKRTWWLPDFSKRNKKFENQHVAVGSPEKGDKIGPIRYGFDSQPLNLSVPTPVFIHNRDLTYSYSTSTGDPQLTYDDQSGNSGIVHSNIKWQYEIHPTNGTLPVNFQFLHWEYTQESWPTYYYYDVLMQYYAPRSTGIALIILHV